MKRYRDIVGDGGSGVAEQVGDLRSRIALRLSDVKHRIAIGSGKGGVGKSTLTLQLAASLSRRGLRCAILDADMNGPSQARLAGLRGVPFVPGSEGLIVPVNDAGIGVISLGSLIPESDALEFDSVAQGDSHTWRATREFSTLAEIMASVHWGELDFLLFDLPPGAERTFQYAEFLGRETAFVMVTAPSELSRGVVARSLAALSRTPNPVLGYIENMSGYYCADCDEIRPLFPASESPELAAPCLGSVPFVPRLAERCDRGEASAADPGSPAVQAVDRIASHILQEVEER